MNVAFLLKADIQSPEIDVCSTLKRRHSSVDPAQAYSLALDFERVAADHPGRAGHVGQGGCGEQEQGDSRGAHFFIVP